MGTGKLCLIYFRQDVRKVDFFTNFSNNKSFTFQLLQIFDGTRPEDESCMDIVKEMYNKSKFYHLKVGNLQEIKKK